MGFLDKLFGKKSSAPGSDAIAVGAISEEYEWLAQHPCACGGRWGVGMQALEAHSEDGRFKVDRMELACSSCGTPRTVRFKVDSQSPKYQAEQRAMMAELGLSDDDVAS